MESTTKAIVTLKPNESKRLIAKGVCELDIIKSAFNNKKILISNGSTTGYVVEELLNISIDKKRFPCGIITNGRTCITPDTRIRSILISNKERINNNIELSVYEELELILNDFGSGDIYIKGANAIDVAGNAGFLLAHPNGGNLLLAWKRISTHDVKFIIPVGLEKLIPSVIDADKCVTGIDSYDYALGCRVGYFCVSNAIVFTEIEAFKNLFGLTAEVISSGGVGDSTGCVTFHIEGSEDNIKKMINLIREIKKEKNVLGWKQSCSTCDNPCLLKN